MSDAAEQAAFDRILERLQQSRGFDFTAYKRTSLMRRMKKRMQAIGLQRFDEYLEYMQVRPGECAPLFNTILINVTSFFRDPDVWETLQTRVIPTLNAGQPGKSQLRVWSAGCGSGQEAYTAAMMLAEELGLDAFRDRVKLFATDVDEEALAEARQAVYSSRQVSDVRAPLLEKYFDCSGDLYTFNRDLRRSVIFGRHDLIHDAPISRVDLLLCRNTLMYFNSDAQNRIMARFYFSVRPGGFLALGRSEMLLSHPAMFQPVDLERCIFRTVPRVKPRDRLLLLAQSGREGNVPQQNLGTRVSVLEVMPYKTLRDGQRHSNQELEAAYEELQSRNGELETTNEELQSTVEELETTNEELQSTNEELETMNEELQSTNQELQTMNEELRNRTTELASTNAFLEGVFSSLRSAVVVLDREMRVQVWNAGAADLWGLRADQTLREYFFALDIGLPVRELHQPIRDVLDGQPSGEIVVAATSRTGKPLRCRVSVSPLLGVERSTTGVILLMEAQAHVATRPA